MSDIKVYEVSLEVDEGEKLDHKFVGFCKNCGKEIYAGDTIFDCEYGRGEYCMDCLEVAIEQMLKTA